MKVVFFGNGALACKVLGDLVESDEVLAVVLHPEEKARNRESLLALAASVGARVLEADDLSVPHTVEQINALGAEVGLSIMFGYILRKDVLEVFPKGCINLHPAYLPYNRGAHPNVWPLVDGTPAGVTLHLIDVGVDTGPILAQRKVDVQASDTAETLYARLMSEAFELFKDAWPAVQLGELKAMSQQGKGTSHRVSDLSKLDVIDLDATTTARQLLNQLRARSFPPYSGAHFLDEKGKKVFVRVKLTRED